MESKRAQRRFLFLIVALLLAVVIIVVRLSQLMIFNPRASPQGSISFPKIERGPILDRNGRVLVLSPPTVGQELKEAFGNQVFLTLNINIQYFIEKIALQAFEENKADSVHIMVMDAKNGEILGYASFPSFDPNEYNNAPGNALRNLPLTRAYEPGSVFKIISVASFMELGSINLQDQFFCNGFYKKAPPDGEGSMALAFRQKPVPSGPASEETRSISRGNIHSPAGARIKAAGEPVLLV